MALDDRPAAADPLHLIAALRRERDEALAREAAIAEVLQVINASPGDLAPVFDAMLEKAMRLCDASFGLRFSIDGDSARIVAAREVPDPFNDYLAQNPLGIGPDTFFGRAILQRSVLHTTDIRESSQYRGGQPLTVNAADHAGVRALLMAPLLKDDDVIGVFAIFRREVCPFTDKQIALLQNFAAQAVIAMENARLITETREALEQQTATAEVLGVINASPGDLGPVFDAILEKAHALCGASSGALVEVDGDRYRPVAVHGEQKFTEDWMKVGWVQFPTSEGTFFARLRRGELVHVQDVSVDTSPKSKEYNRLIESSGTRSLILVPLRKDGVLFGAITAFRQEVRPFSDKEIALLENFAAQAVIAMENARLITETRVALEQQTATAEVLGVINASPGDLAPVFSAMLEKATSLSEAAFGILWLCEGERLHAAALHGVPASYAEVARIPIQPRPDNPLGRMLRGERLIVSTDVADEEPYRAGDPARRALVDIGGARSAVQMALVKDGNLLGSLTVFRQEVRPFSDKQIALLQNFAAQAVIAMENARLITETREALEQQTATAEVLGVINSSPGDLAPVFDALLDKAMRLCGFDHGSLQTFDGQQFHAVAVRGLPEPIAVRLREGFRPGPQNPMARLLDGDRFVHIPDLSQVEEARLAVEHGSRSLLCIPLRKDDALLGQIVAVRQEVRPFGEKEIVLLENFAAQAVIAMENARLITETREALEQQTATAEVLGVINASPGDLAPVFDAILERAMSRCDAAFGFMTIYDGQAFTPCAMRNVPEPLAEYFAKGMDQPQHGDAHWQLLQGADLVHNVDQKADDAYRSGNPLRRAVVDLGGTRTALVVALRKDGILRGTLTLYRQEVRPFADKQIALLQNFAAQAVIAMENARLITETREALEQQTATAEVLGVINSSPGDLGPVFDAMLEKAMTLCGAAFGILNTYDGQRFDVGALRGVPTEVEAVLRSAQPSPHGVGAGVLRGEDVVRIDDFADSPAYRAGAARARALVDLGGVRSYVGVALRKDGRLLGTIGVYRQEVRPFTDKQIALLQNFAAQAVIAMENARLITETREALDQQTATAEVLGVINSSPGDLAPVFDIVLEKAMQLCGGAFGYMTGGAGDTAREPPVIATHGVPAAFAEFIRNNPFPRTPGSVAERILGGEPVVHVRDLADDDLYRSGDPHRRAIVELGGVRSLLVAALKREGEVLGGISIYRQEVRPFSEKQIALLQNFAAQAVIAMENARLLGELRQRTEEVAELNRGLEVRVAEQVEELGRVGRLKRFLAPQLAELIVSQGDEKILESHRCEIVVVFCDLRGYTAFTETAEPEEVLNFLREYHGALGPLVEQFEGTLDQFSGDGIMVFFNDPVPIPDPAERAVTMAVAMREAAGPLIASWRRCGRELGFGAGIAQGYATLGQIGFAERSGYTAIGTVCNLAARLCAEAKDGQILIAQRVAAAVEQTMALETIGSLTLKGLTQPVVAFNVPNAATPSNRPERATPSAPAG